MEYRKILFAALIALITGAISWGSLNFFDTLQYKELSKADSTGLHHSMDENTTAIKAIQIDIAAIKVTTESNAVALQEINRYLRDLNRHLAESERNEPFKTSEIMP